MSTRKTAVQILIAGLVFVALAVVVVWMASVQIVSLAAGRLMLIGLLGLYVGIGILVGVYRLVHNMR